MALPISRHFKIRFDSYFIFGDVRFNKVETEDLSGLFQYVVRGMKFAFDYYLDKNHDVAAIEWSKEADQLPNGTWTGVMGLLNRSEIDYAPAALMLTEEGWNAVAYNYPYANDEIVFATRKPKYTPEITSLFRTLSPNVWLSLLACIILVTLACFVALKHRCTLEDILLHVLAIGLNQEGNLVHKRVGEFLLLCTWTGAMAVFTLCFKSVLLSFLTFPPVGGVRTVPELAAAIRAGQYIAFTYPDNDFASYLQKSPNEDIRVIGESMLKNPVGRIFDVLDESPKYPIKAFVHRKYIVSPFEEVLYVSKDNMGSFNFATAVSKNFCYKDEMDMLVHKFLAAGINVKINRFRNHYFAAGIHYIRFYQELLDEEKNRKITMMDLSGAFILLLAGHCLSICVFITECWINRRERRHSLKRKKKSDAV